MIDRSREIVELLAVHLAEADLGRGTAMIDAEALTVVRSDAEDLICLCFVTFRYC